MSTQEKTKQTKDAMSEGSGTTGGYTIPETKPDAEAVKSAITGIMQKYEDAAPPDGPHDAYHHEEKGIAYHHHSADASTEYLKAVESDLATVDGVQAVAQSHEPPGEEGYQKVYSRTRQKGEMPTEEDIEHGGGKPDTPEAKAAAKAQRKALALGRIVARGKAYMAARKFLPPKKRSALEECVHRKIPKIAEDHPEMEEDQRTAVAYSMCGEKAFGDEDYEHKDDMEFAELEAPVVEEEDHTDHPHGAQLASTLIDDLESGIQQSEPETREFFEGILEEVRGWATDRYPDADFAGDPDTESGTQASEEAEETDEALERYRSPLPPPKRCRAARRKGLSLAVVKKSLGRHGLKVIKEATDEMHDLADMDPKGFSPRHQKRLRVHARNLDQMHGALLGVHEKDEDPLGDDKPADVGRDGSLAEQPADEAMDVKAAQALLKAFDDAEKQLGRLNDGHYAITGKRCF